tara:strand:+ start:77 stop:394 length:318 start_codon:yes stop_codon:yes gene_type:complete
MKEIEAIKMRKDIKFLKQYGFTDASISRYIGNISDRAIREFVENESRMLSNANHENLKTWIDETIKKINALVDDPIKNLSYQEREELERWLRNRKVNKALMKIYE